MRNDWTIKVIIVFATSSLYYFILIISYMMEHSDLVQELELSVLNLYNNLHALLRYDSDGREDSSPLVEKKPTRYGTPPKSIMGK